MTFGGSTYGRLGYHYFANIVMIIYKFKCKYVYLEIYYMLICVSLQNISIYYEYISYIYMNHI